MFRLRLLVPVLLTLSAATAGTAAAATITVNTTLDGTNPGQCSLREAILDVDSPGSPVGNCAAAAFGANTIVLGGGTYTLGIGFTTLSVSATVTTLTIQGAGEGQSEIDASRLASTALDIAQGATVSLSGLTIANAHAANGSPGSDGTGGSGGDGTNGGAIYNQGTLTLNDAAVTNSQAGGGGGGGIGGAGAQGGTGGKGGGGGGIYNTGTLILNGATLSGDTAGAGGSGGTGGANDSGTGGAGGNGGDGGFGGALLSANGSVTITASTLSGNASGAGGAGATGGTGSTTGGAGGAGGDGKDGGGIDSAGAGGSVTITNSTFASNTAGAGGAGGAGGSGGTTGGAGNQGGDGAGGGAINVFPGTLSLQSDTIAGNATGTGANGGTGGAGPTAGAPGTAGDGGVGGGLGPAGTVTVQNTLLASNSGGNCGGLTVDDSGHNLSFGDASCPETFLSGDSQLGALQSNGGPTETISLGVGSSALDQVPPTGAGCQATDQRGVARPSGTECDIGAYEVAPPTAETGPAKAITAKGATLTATVTPNAGATTVTFEYGTTTKYGKSKNVSGITGVVSIAADGAIKGLKPGTTYHYRVLVTTMDGSATGADRTFKAKAPASLSRLKVSSGRKSDTVTYRDSEAATTTLKVLGSKTHGRAKTVATLTHRDKTGSNRVKLSLKHLKAGRYVLEATPRLDGQNGATVSAKFRVT
jgi:CSLREA domain-containing protein